MKKYKFLLKPLFFIFNIIFATWLVLMIERIKPSDFGAYQSVFESPAKKTAREEKVFLKSLVHSYKSGKIDSVKLEEQLDRFLAGKNNHPPVK
jgi:hypothetical protein